MLCVNSYKKEYIDECAQAWKRSMLLTRTWSPQGERKVGPGNRLSARRTIHLGPLFLNNLVVVLDSFFVHRSRTLEKKDGNPLNEFELGEP